MQNSREIDAWKIEVKSFRDDMNKGFDKLTTRLDRFMIGSTITTLVANCFVVGAIKLF